MRTKKLSAKDRIILALDVNHIGKAREILQGIGPHVGCIKVGLEAIAAFGPAAMDMISDLRLKIFYDGKFSDIPNTVGRATKVLADRRVEFIDVHASTGIEAIKSAVANCKDSKVLVVSVLTSIDQEECLKIFGETLDNAVINFADMAIEAGAHGIICSANELKVLARYRKFDGLLRVTPGIQPIWQSATDQKRVMTPGEAIKAGADYLVIGRAITDPNPHGNPDGPAPGDSLKAVELITKEIEEAMEVMAKIPA